MWKKIKKDWDACWSGILILIGLWVVNDVFGKGLCIFRAKWGIPCPGCGMTRSMLMILRGQFSVAWKMHPFAYGWLVFGVIFFVDRYVVQGKEIVWKIALALLGTGMMIRYVFWVLPGVW